ncbi:recombinase family protein [Streptomyces sp. FXJ1.4098]|nr:recombinase family protein [Streptomyces sp. FXJ1.4098]
MRPKKKLVPHPDERRFDAARELCRLRREEHLKGPDIVAILKAEPDRYPIEGEWTYNRVEGLVSNPKLTGYQVYNRRATRTGRAGFSRRNPISQWVWSPKVVHKPVVGLEEWMQAQEVTAGLRAGVEGGPLLRVRAAASRLGLTVTAVSSNATHTLYRIGNRQFALPTPVPDTLVQQVIEDLGSAV